MKIKTLLKISLIIIISMLFIRPLFKRTLQPLPKPTTSTSETVTHNYIENEDALVHGYYSSIEEAMKHNRFGEDSEPANYTIKKKIKILEDDESCILYAVNIQPDGTEIFSLFKFKITREQDKKKYSNPIMHLPSGWEFISSIEKKQTLTNGQQTLLPLFNLSGTDEKVDKYPNFVWSLSVDKDVYNLKVNGEKPTEIIPFKLDSHQIYYYYFNDLEKHDDFVVTVQ